MTAWMLDRLNGNANYSGDSWAVTKFGVDGQTYNTTKFTSASAPFVAGDVGRYIRIVASLFRIVAYASATEVTLNATYSTGSARNWWIGGAVTGPADLSATLTVTGDELREAQTPNCDAAGAGNMTWTNGSASLAIAANRVKRVDDCESGWVAATNVVATHGTSNAVQGTKAIGLAPASAFTTGKVAYKALAGATDFSAFQGLSFMFAVRGSTLVTVAQGWRICLCSDTTGDTIVDDLTIPLVGSIYGGGRYPMTVFAAGNLGSSIQSVAVYVTVDPGAPTVDFDDIVAVKAVADADHICHRCLLAQGSDLRDYLWWGIKCFADEATITLCGEAYEITAGSVATYRREIVPVLGKYFGNLSGVGTGVLPVRISGGWNPATGLQSGVSAYMTWRDKQSGTDNLFNVVAASSFIEWDNFIFGMTDAINPFAFSNGYQDGLKFTNMNWVGCMATGEGSIGLGDIAGGSTAEQSWEGWGFNSVHFVGFPSYALFIDPLSDTYHQFATGWKFTDFRAISTRGVRVGQAIGWRGTDFEVSNCPDTSAPRGFVLYDCCMDWEFNRITLKDNPAFGLDIQVHLTNGRLFNLVTSGNASGAVRVRRSDLRLFNAQMAEATKFAEVHAGGRVASIKDGGVADTHLITRPEGIVRSEVTVRHTALGIAWKMSPANASQWPLTEKFGEIALAAGSYNVSIFLRRDDTGISGRFFTPGGQVGGVPEEVSDSIVANANVWEEQVLYLSLTEAGVVDLFVEAQGGTTLNLYVDDIAVVAA